MNPSLDAVLEPDVLAAAAGDTQAFARLVDRTRSTVCSISLAIVRDIHASEDVAQDVYLAAWSGMKKLRNPKSFLPWIRQTTRNRAKTWLRDRGRQRLSDRDADSLLVRVADSRHRLDEGLMEDEKLQALVASIDDLPSQSREVVTLFYREGRSVRQVADLLELREAAVKKRLSRARQVLRSNVMERLGEALAQSGPKAAFTATVLGVLTTGATPAAAATSAAAVSGAGGAKTAIKLGAWVGGAGLGAVAGLFALLFGMRYAFRDARDSRETAQLTVYATVGTVLILLTCIAFTFPWETWVGPTAVYVMFISALGIMNFSVLPRIIKFRLQAELTEDPSAAGRHREQWRMARFGFCIGAISGGAGLAGGLYRSGLLP